VRRVASTRQTTTTLRDAWQLAGVPAGAAEGPADLAGLDWLPAAVPGTVAGALREAGRWDGREALHIDGSDWWLRCRFDAERATAGEQAILALDGLATVSEVWLNGERLLSSESMFRRHRLDVGGRLAGPNELMIAIRALRPRLRGRRKPRARWRTRLVEEPNLRFVRTMLLGRAPGFAPGPAVAGAWRPVSLERHAGLRAEVQTLRTRVEARTGILDASVTLTALDGEAPTAAALELREVGGAGAVQRAELSLVPDGSAWTARGTLSAPDAARWWPHTHGEPVRHRLRLLVTRAAGTAELDLGHVAFRVLETPDPGGPEGLKLRVNGVPVFARGALWTPDLLDPTPEAGELRRTLELTAAAGFNMLRIPGTGAYESEAFHDLCDELGILVWQDLPFANFDYPEADPEFMAEVQDEVRAALADLQGHPSLALVCGGSEVAQQVAMLGLDPALANGPLFGELLPRLVEESGLGVPYIPSSPWGGGLPFRNDHGVAHYFGVGGYRRGFEDVRRAEVKFASECLALANVPDDPVLESLTATGRPPLGTPAWKASVPRDATTSWDFEDVRDHYLRLLYGVDPGELRATDPERYLELSRATSGEVMAEVFGEWRRPASGCGGGLVLWLADLTPGSGWGILDHRRLAKPVYHHLRRALAPVAVWSTDEGLNGIAVHVANDLPNTLSAVLRIALYRGFEVCVARSESEISMEPHTQRTENLEELLGSFVDAGWAYRFGPPAQDVIALSLESPDRQPISQSFRLPLGPPRSRENARALGLTARVTPGEDGRAEVAVCADRYLHGVRLDVPGFVAEDSWFALEPGRERRVGVAPWPALPAGRGGGDAEPARGTLSAINLSGTVPLEPGP